MFQWEIAPPISKLRVRESWGEKLQIFVDEDELNEAYGTNNQAYGKLETKIR